MPAKKRDVEWQVWDGAVNDLTNYIARISGVCPELIEASGPADVKGPAIVLGELARLCGARPADRSRGGEAFVRQVKGERVLLAGDSPMGDAYAVFAFLNEIGVEWVMPGALGEVIPVNRTIEVSEGDVESVPSFERRVYSPNSPTHDHYVWQMRNRMQDYGELLRKGILCGDLACWHKFKNKKYDAWFEKYPEMVPIQVKDDGTTYRRRKQFNTLKPETLIFATNYLASVYADRKLPKDAPCRIGFGPADGDGWDESPETLDKLWRRRDPLTGKYDMSDLLCDFYNRCLAAMKPEYPNLKLCAFVYDCYGDFPRTVKPSKDLIVTIAPIAPSRLHGICDADKAPSMAYYKHQLEQWAANGNEIDFFSFNYNLAEETLPFSQVRIIGLDMPYYHKLGVKGFRDAPAARDMCFSAPSDFLKMKMMWNVGLDWKKEVERFCHLAYGKGWKEMYDYWLFVAQKQADGGDEAGAFFGIANLYDEDDVDRMKKWMEDAEGAAERPEEKARVRVAAYCVRQLENYLAFKESYCDYDFAAARKAYDRMVETADNTRTNGYDHAGGYLEYIRAYPGAFINGVEKILKDGEIIARFPEEVRYMYEPSGLGEKLNLQSPLLRDDEYLTMHTYKSDMSRQGGIGFRHGDLWFRAKVKLPKVELKEGEGVGFCLGGFDAKATVYVNGACCGRVYAFAVPQAFDITPFLAPAGEENSIVIRVERPSNEEMFTGGLIYPSFFFKGPRVPKRGMAVDESFRITLPGERSL